MANNDMNLLLAAGLGLLAWSWLTQRATGQVPLFSGGGWGAGNLSWTNDEEVGLPGAGAGTGTTPFATVGSTPTGYNPYGGATTISNINTASWVNPPQLGVNGVTESVLAQYGLTPASIEPKAFIAKHNASRANANTRVTTTLSAPGAPITTTQTYGINTQGKFFNQAPVSIPKVGVNGITQAILNQYGIK